jgi:menaquinol-cytochrome c reductase iron-sulfur subunit
MEQRACHSCTPGSRRNFLKKIFAAGVSGLIGLVPLAAGLAVFLDPLRRKASAAEAVRVTTLDALPDDGVPRQFPVVARSSDAWSKSASARVGAVYLRRTADGGVQALNVVCPHAGCFVDFLAERNGFLCPCHNSSFALDGKIADPASPAARAMDSLPVEVRNGNEVWVTFQNFQAGRAEKVPVA